MRVSCVGLVRVRLIGSGFTRLAKDETGRHDLVSFSANMGITDEPGIRGRKVWSAKMQVCARFYYMYFLTLGRTGPQAYFLNLHFKYTATLIAGNYESGATGDSILQSCSIHTGWAVLGSEMRRCLQMSPSF